MLLFSTSPLTVDGITVFPDHEKKDQFWYLQGPVDLALLPNSDEPQFSLLEYASDVAGTGVKGVGFLNVTLCLKPPKKTLNAIVEQIKAAFPDVDDPKLSAVPFDEGSVQIVALDLQGGGGTINTAREGTFVAVEHILGAVSPELFGDNNALFALTLTEDGATILKAAFEDGVAPPTQAEGMYNISRSDLAVVEAAVDKLTIRAPIAGTVLQVNAKVGELASPASPQPLVVLADLTALRVRAKVELSPGADTKLVGKATFKVDGNPVEARWEIAPAADGSAEARCEWLDWDSASKTAVARGFVARKFRPLRKVG